MSNVSWRVHNLPVWIIVDNSYVVPVHVLLGFEELLLEQCVLLSVEHLKTFRTLDE